MLHDLLIRDWKVLCADIGERRAGTLAEHHAAAIGARNSQINIGGYDHAFVLADKPRSKPALAAEVVEPKSSRVMELRTDLPGVQFYTATYTTTLKGLGGATYDRFHGFCLETQHHPDSVHHAAFPSTILRPGTTYRTVTTHHFSTR